MKRKKDWLWKCCLPLSIMILAMMAPAWSDASRLVSEKEWTKGFVEVAKKLGMYEAVAEGKTLAEPLSKAKVFPPMVTHMIAVGESTGALDTMLSKIADFYDDEVDAAVSNLTALMEPMIMVFLGATVGFIVVAMYLPIFKLITLIK
jgi:type II secretory pathway component PulF